MTFSYPAGPATNDIDRLPEPRSLWATSAGEAEPVFESLAGEQQTDVAVIGGGFTGLSAALHLAQTGTRVTLLEAHRIGWGASGRNGGQVIAGLKHNPDDLERLFPGEPGRALVDAAGNAPGLVFDLIERHGIACDANRSGWLQPAHNKAAMAKLAERARQWETRNAPVTVLDRDQVEQALGSRCYVGGCIDHRGGSVQPLSYCRGLARTAAKAGTTIHVRSAVRKMERYGEGWRLHTADGTLDAGTVILATNGYTGDLWPGLARSILPAYSFQIATAPVPEPLRSTVLPGRYAVSDSHRLLFYYRYDAHGRMIIGGRGPFRDMPEAGDGIALRVGLDTIFPALKTVPLEYCWCGRIALTRDHIPHLHRLAPNVFTALGYNGRGVALATLLGQCLAKLANGEQDNVAFPVTSLRPIPLHRIHRPVLKLIIQYYRLRDRSESSECYSQA